MILKDITKLNFIEENIWVIHNFVKKEESEIYLKIARSAKEEDWWKENGGWYKGKYLNLSKNDTIQKLANDIIKRFSNLFVNGDKYT